MAETSSVWPHAPFGLVWVKAHITHRSFILSTWMRSVIPHMSHTDVDFYKRIPEKAWTSSMALVYPESVSVCNGWVNWTEAAGTTYVNYVYLVPELLPHRKEIIESIPWPSSKLVTTHPHKKLIPPELRCWPHSRWAILLSVDSRA